MKMKKLLVFLFCLFPLVTFASNNSKSKLSGDDVAGIIFIVLMFLSFPSMIFFSIYNLFSKKSKIKYIKTYIMISIIVFLLSIIFVGLYMHNAVFSSVF
ncbi:hypothetical protein D4R51_04315 [bacterium]|nr:MAG: hypothetical protein D4R51_04315 [bacterium]